jgi:hypothetical protein
MVERVKMNWSKVDREILEEEKSVADEIGINIKRSTAREAKDTTDSMNIYMGQKENSPKQSERNCMSIGHF